MAECWAHITIAVTSERRLSLTEWGRYHIMHRGSVPSHWQRCGHIAMEFYCDLWAQVEARQCSFHRLPAQQLKYFSDIHSCAVDNDCDDASQVSGRQSGCSGGSVELGRSRFRNRLCCRSDAVIICWQCSVLPAALSRCPGLTETFRQTGPVHHSYM